MSDITRFMRFVMYEHPDPDSISAKTVDDAFEELSSLAEAFHKKIGVENCSSCGRPFGEIDKKTERSRPKHICASCFTSNA